MIIVIHTRLPFSPFATNVEQLSAESHLENRVLIRGGLVSRPSTYLILVYREQSCIHRLTSFHQNKREDFD